MFDLSTLKIVSFLNDMALKSKKGVVPLSRVMDFNACDKIVYDDSKPRFVPTDVVAEYPIVSHVYDFEGERQVRYLEDFPVFGMKYAFSTDVNPIETSIIGGRIIVGLDSADTYVIIEDGKWSCVSSEN